MDLEFIKMHGIGNDFIIFDGRDSELSLTSKQVKFLANRYFGIGCDQVIIEDSPKDSKNDASMRIYNSNGKKAAICGNGSRCVALLSMMDSGRNSAFIETPVGVWNFVRISNNDVRLDMGRVTPILRELNFSSNYFPLLSNVVSVDIGNSHAVVFISDISAITFNNIGAFLENQHLFPDNTNIEVVSVVNNRQIRAKVWESGVGATNACGTGACAIALAAQYKNLTGESVEVIFDHGSIVVELTGGHIVSTGSVSLSFTGEINLDSLRKDIDIVDNF